MTLLAAYSFNEGAGDTALEASGGAPITGIPGWAPGRDGTALRIDGTAGPVVDPYAVSGAFTIMVDVYLDGPGGGGVNMLLNNGTLGNIQVVNADGRLEWYPSIYVPPTTGVVTPGAWYNLALTGDNTARRAYLDGVLVGTGGPGLSGTDPITLGGIAGYLPNIRLENPRFFDTVLSADEIAALAGTPVGSGAPANIPPVARAGADQAADTGAQVTLSGATSSDPDGTVATYDWHQVSGTAVTLIGAGASRTFTAPETTGPLVFGLTVTDAEGLVSAEDRVTVTVVQAPAAPGAGLLSADDMAFMRETQAEARPTEAELIRVTQGTSPSGGRTDTRAAPELIRVRLDGKEKAVPNVVAAVVGSAKPVKVVMDLVEVRAGDIIRVNGDEYQVITGADPDEWATAQVVWTKRVRQAPR